MELKLNYETITVRKVNHLVLESFINQVLGFVNGLQPYELVCANEYSNYPSVNISIDVYDKKQIESYIEKVKNKITVRDEEMPRLGQLLSYIRFIKPELDIPDKLQVAISW